MDDAISFNVSEGGAPNLQGEGQDAPSVDPELPLEPVALPNLWTAEEAAALISAVYNVGVLVWGPEWASHPVEFKASGTMLAPQLDLFMPKSAGGNYATVGVGLLACAGELAGATARRWPLLKRGPKPLWVPAKPAGGLGPSATQATDAAAETSAGPQAPASGGSYRLPKDLLRVIPQKDDGALSGVGL